MQWPEGQKFPNLGCYLEIVENEKPVWTNAMAPGYWPTSPLGWEGCGAFLFTAIISLEAQRQFTKYTALVIHADEDGRRKHEEMGFHDGWSAALDQLIAVTKGM
jgi:uncharacterized protein YndB with AHSA1/START domain